MIWAKRRFKWAEYSPYFDRMEKLQIVNVAQYRQFMMVSVGTEKVGMSDVYVGVPSEPLISVFDGFDLIEESSLPKVVDTLLIADIAEFETRFEFSHNRR